MNKNKLTLKILFLLILTDILETFLQFCFKKSVLAQANLQVDNFQAALIFLSAAFSSGFLWLGLFSVVAVFIIWSTILSKIDLSVAVPIASFSYILVPLASIIFLNEKVSLLRWAGILFILTGIIFVSLSTKKDKSVLE